MVNIPFISRVDDDEGEPDSSGNRDGSTGDSGSSTSETGTETTETADSQSQEPSDEAVQQYEDRLSALETEIGTVHDEINSLEQNGLLLEDRIETLEDDKEELQQNLQELLGIYDAVASTVNPLFEDDLQSIIPELPTEMEEASNDYNLKTADETSSIPEKPVSEDKGVKEDSMEMDFESEPISDTESELDEQMQVDNNSESEQVVSMIEGTVHNEVIALQWLDNLVDTVGYHGAIKTIDYYTRIGWLSMDAKHQLIGRLRLYNAEDANRDELDDGGIPTSVHRYSQEYISRLSQR